jgi:hypothetical protein
MAKTTYNIPATYYSDHDRKNVIRSQWCKPQIEILSKKLKKKLIYIGLPDLKALDVLEWINYLDKVIAFQCTEYNERPVNVKELEDLLEDLERKNLLRTSIVYHGWMEEIVMGGLSAIGQTYTQSEFLKIYNLDFCNSFTTPATVRNEWGRTIKIIYKCEVIDKLLEYQKNIGKGDEGSKFLMYLTVNANTFEEDTSFMKDKIFKEYLKKVNTIKKPDVHAARKMKVYCFALLRDIFHRNDFHAEFLPPIFYFGSSYPNKKKGGEMDNHHMMTFTILGTKRNAAEALYLQNEEDFLNSQFIFADSTKISCYTDRYITETAYKPNVSELLLNSHTCQHLW